MPSHTVYTNKFSKRRYDDMIKATSSFYDSFLFLAWDSLRVEPSDSALLYYQSMSTSPLSPDGSWGPAGRSVHAAFHVATDLFSPFSKTSSTARLHMLIDL